MSEGAPDQPVVLTPMVGIELDHLVNLARAAMGAGDVRAWVRARAERGQAGWFASSAGGQPTAVPPFDADAADWACLDVTADEFELVTTSGWAAGGRDAGGSWAFVLEVEHASPEAVLDLARQAAGLVRAHAVALDQEQRRQAERRAHDAELTSLRSFSFALAHNLGGPIRRAHALGQMLCEELDLSNHQMFSHLRRVNESALQLVRGLQDLLLLDRSAPPSTPTDANVCAANAKAESVVELLRCRATCEFGKLPPLGVAAPLLTLVLRNLIHNAIKYRDPDRNLEIKIHARGAPQADRVELVVDDNGSGIDIEQARTAFEPFVRLQAGSKIPGSGLGLTIIRRIAESVGGHAWFESKDEPGCRMVLSLPTPTAPSPTPVLSA